MLETKMAVLKAMNTTVEGDSDDRITFNVQGTNKAIRIDMKKLKEAITFENTVVERQSTKEDHMTKVEEIQEGLTDEEFLNKAVELVGTIEKNENKTFKKDSFIKIFKYSGDFAKGKQTELKKQAQEKRFELYEKDWKKYLTAIKDQAQAEEKAYEKACEELFDKLCITQANFERSQQNLMETDPGCQMEIFNIMLQWDKPTIESPEELTQ